HQEAAEAAGVSIDDEKGLVEAGRRVLDLIKKRAVLVNRGGERMNLFTGTDKKGASGTQISTLSREVYDGTRAGDTVIATLVLALASGASLEEAAVLANHGAGVVVAKVGTASVTRDELLATI